MSVHCRSTRSPSLPIGTVREVFPQGARPASFIERVMDRSCSCYLHAKLPALGRGWIFQSAYSPSKSQRSAERPPTAIKRGCLVRDDRSNALRRIAGPSCQHQWHRTCARLVAAGPFLKSNGSSSLRCARAHRFARLRVNRASTQPACVIGGRATVLGNGGRQRRRSEFAPARQVRGCSP